MYFYLSTHTEQHLTSLDQFYLFYQYVLLQATDTKIDEKIDEMGRSALFRAISSGQVSKVERLIKAGNVVL